MDKDLRVRLIGTVCIVLWYVRMYVRMCLERLEIQRWCCVSDAATCRNISTASTSTTSRGQVRQIYVSTYVVNESGAYICMAYAGVHVQYRTMKHHMQAYIC